MVSTGSDGWTAPMQQMVRIARDDREKSLLVLSLPDSIQCADVGTYPRGSDELKRTTLTDGPADMGKPRGHPRLSSPQLLSTHGCASVFSPRYELYFGLRLRILLLKVVLPMLPPRRQRGKRPGPWWFRVSCNLPGWVLPLVLLCVSLILPHGEFLLKSTSTTNTG